MGAKPPPLIRAKREKILRYAKMLSSIMSRCDKEYRHQRLKESLLNKLDKRHRYYLKNQTAAYTDTVRIRVNRFKNKCVKGLVNIHTIEKEGIQNRLDRLFRPCPPPGRKQYSAKERVYYDSMHEQQKQVRISMAKFKVSTELTVAHYNNSYMIFNTLTVAPNLYKDFMTDDRPYLKDYKTRCRKHFGRHPYFGVWELGKDTGRLHYHFIHILSKIPAADPNLGSPEPQVKAFPSLKKLWKYGISDPVPLRYENDHYQRFGFKWPYKDGKPYEAKPVQATGSYVAKYLLKEQLKWKPKTRTSTSRNFGLTPITEAMKSLSKNSLIAILDDPTIQPTFITPIPRSLLKQEAMKLLLKTSVSTKELSTLRHKLKPQLTQLQRLQTLTPQKQMSNSQKITSMLMTNIKPLDIYNIYQAFETVESKYNTNIMRGVGYYVR